MVPGGSGMAAGTAAGDEDLGLIRVGKVSAVGAHHTQRLRGRPADGLYRWRMCSIRSDKGAGKASTS